MIEAHRRNVGVAFGTLLASSATLVCCVLPAALVSIGAGAAMVGLISAFPQLVWLSEHKGWVFGIAAFLLIASGASNKAILAIDRITAAAIGPAVIADRGFATCTGRRVTS